MKKIKWKLKDIEEAIEMGGIIEISVEVLKDILLKVRKKTLKEKEWIIKDLNKALQARDKEIEKLEEYKNRL